jgi:hypothetical protein
MATKTKIVIGYMADGASSDPTVITDESFNARFGEYVQLEHVNLAAGSTVVTDITGMIVYTEGAAADYVMDNLHGRLLTVTATTTMVDGDPHLIDYTFNEPNLAYKISQAIDLEGSDHEVRTTRVGRMGVAVIIYTP